MTHVPHSTGEHSSGGGAGTVIVAGIIIGGFGALHLMSLMNMPLPFDVPQDYLEYGSAIGAALGGLYMIYKTVFRHRIILY